MESIFFKVLSFIAIYSSVRLFRYTINLAVRWGVKPKDRSLKKEIILGLLCMLTLVLTGISQHIWLLS
jgi:hypothetical protein